MTETPAAASFIVIDPNGHRARVPIQPIPFRIGRLAENNLVVRDSRASRTHAQILIEGGDYIVEDTGSRHGVFVNGARVARHHLHNSDRIEFGVPDSYQLVFHTGGGDLSRLVEQFPARDARTEAPGVGANLGKLRAVLEVARTLQTSFSVQAVLDSVVDAALAVTGAERGFLLLQNDGRLEMRCARDRQGGQVSESDLRVPRSLIHRALRQRRDLFSMTFDPAAAHGPSASIADLELRSVVCVPLLRISNASSDATNVISAISDTAGVLYMDSREIASDLSAGNRELLQTLAIEASTILENARLLDEERIKQKMEEELNLARAIQQSLLPRSMPREGWLRAAGSSTASHQVGGDYFDVRPVLPSGWLAVVSDVSGKGVSSALLASLLQGAFLTAPDGSHFLEGTLQRVNRFLNERTQGEKYATVFYGLLEEDGQLHYVNAGHCAPMLVNPDSPLTYLETTAMPVGLMEEADFPSAEARLDCGGKIVIYSDGVTEAQDPAGAFFGRRRLREAVVAKATGSCEEMHEAIRDSVHLFTRGAAQADDITILVLERVCPDAG